MNEMRNDTQTHDAGDPLGLRGLPELDSSRDAWPAIERALARRRRWHRGLAGLAVAASVVLAVTVVMRLPGPTPRSEPGAVPGAQVAEQTPAETAAPGAQVATLVSLSQQLERQLRALRGGVAAMPAEAVVAQAELQDLIAQVDLELSHEPESVNLWGQRVNLLLDLHQLYRQELRRDGVLVASL